MILGISSYDVCCFTMRFSVHHNMKQPQSGCETALITNLKKSLFSLFCPPVLYISVLQRLTNYPHNSFLRVQNSFRAEFSNLSEANVNIFYIL